MSSRQRLTQAAMLAAILLLALACQSSARDPSQRAISHSLVGKAAPYWCANLPECPDRAEILVLEIWASWCQRCRESLSFIGTLPDEFDKRVSVLGVSIDEEAASFESFRTQDSSGVPLLWDKKQDLAASYGIRQLPALFLIDRDGIVRGVLEGYRPGDDTLLRSLIPPLLKGVAKPDSRSHLTDTR